jgi:glycosyltransferase involved in cell wall biosynthesis
MILKNISREMVALSFDNNRYRVGVLYSAPSLQMSAQYESLADLRDFEFTLLYLNEKQRNPAWPPVCPKRIKCEFLPQPKLPWPASVRYHLNANIIPVLDKYDFDAMILHGIYNSSAVWQSIWWCKKNNRPYLLRCDANVTKEQGFLRRLSRKILISNKIADAGALLYIGTQNKKYYQLYGASQEQFFLAPWEIDYDDIEKYFNDGINKRSENRAELGINENECAIVTVSRLVAWKGYDLLLPVISKLAENDLPIKLIIVGEGSYRKEIEEMVSKYKIPVHLCGNLDRQGVVRCFTASDVFVLASHQEPWGLVVNEAAFCGLPMILSSAVGAGADLLEPGKNGYIFESGDSESLYKYLFRLIQDKALRINMGQKSKAIITEWREQNPAIGGYEKALKHALEINK